MHNVDNFFEKVNLNELNEEGILIDKNHLKLLEDLRNANKEVSDLQKELESRSNNIKKINDNQTRLRENIKSLEKVNSEKLIER